MSWRVLKNLFDFLTLEFCCGKMLKYNNGILSVSQFHRPSLNLAKKD